MKDDQIVYTDKYFETYNKAIITQWDFPDIFWATLAALPANARILDFGCGPGVITRYLHGLRPDLQYYAVDVADVSARLPEYVTFRQTQDEIPFVDNYFDFVIINQVLEHVVNPLSIMKDVHRMLRKTGRCFVAVPSNRAIFAIGDHNLYSDYGHVRAFSKTGLIRLFNDSGFTVMKTALLRNKKTLMITPYLILKSIWRRSLLPLSQAWSHIVGHNIFIVGEK